MKKFIILFAALLLIGCASPAVVQTSAPQPTEQVILIVEQTPVPTEAPTPIPLPTETSVLTEEPAPTAETTVVRRLPETLVLDGAPFGTDIVCFADGFGYAYDIEGWDASDCRLTVEPTATQDLPPYESHRLLLEVGGETFCLAELRYNTEHLNETNVFGLNYEWVVWDSDLVELTPASAKLPSGKKLTECAAFLDSFDAEAHTLSLYTAKSLSTGPDEPLAVDYDTIGDTPVVLTVGEDAALAVLNENGEVMLVTRDRLFGLLADGYIGLLPAPDSDEFTGCRIGYEGETLRYLAEAY